MMLLYFFFPFKSNLSICRPEIQVPLSSDGVPGVAKGRLHTASHVKYDLSGRAHMKRKKEEPHHSPSVEF